MRAIVARLEAYMDELRKAGDSLGARIEVAAHGVPVGLGEPLYDKLDADIAHAMMGINAVKGVEIGAGFARRAARHRAWRRDDAAGLRQQQRRRRPRRDLDRAGHHRSRSRSSRRRSIRSPRRSIDIAGQPAIVETHGRHDPCVGIRATPIAEAMLALVLMDHALRHRAQCGDVGLMAPRIPARSRSKSGAAARRGVDVVASRGSADVRALTWTAQTRAFHSRLATRDRDDAAARLARACPSKSHRNKCTMARHCTGAVRDLRHRRSMNSLRLQLRFLVPLLITLGLGAYFALPVMDRLTLRWFARDLNMRGDLVANTLSDSIAEAINDPEGRRLQTLFDRAAKDERLFAIGLCSLDGSSSATPTTFRAALGSAKRAHVRTAGTACD